MNAPSTRAQQVFGEALALSDAIARRAYLDAACAGDPKLRQEAESLLQAHDQAGDFLKGTRHVASSDLTIEKTGVMVERYKLLEQIGEGGFGVVYMAEQQEPVRRKVALKIIKAGMDTKEVIARFEAERQALALMDHTHIARVYDGGVTKAGRPYFVMELIRGAPITDYCDANRLSIDQRIDLFRKVCQAVQHAHQKGIIHRDLKPTNVLVTVQDDAPVPKIIDFGVAKALQSQLTDKTLFTRFNQWIGTPAYMSPEQASLGSLDVDTRSDIYSLGTILYELLTGCTPFDKRALREKGRDAILQTIREEDVPMPSTRLSSMSHDELQTIADHRSRTPDKLAHSLKGELDWILLKALDRNRARRYETPNALAKDLERFSKGEPISAAPPSFSYQAGKFLRKHPSVVPLAAVSALLIVATTVAVTRYAVTRPRPYDYAGQPLLATLRGHEAQVSAVAHSPKRNLLASASYDGTVKLWAANTGALLATLDGHSGEKVWAVTFSPDGNTLASAGNDGKILLWNVRTKKPGRLFNEDTVPAYRADWEYRALSDLCFSKDGRTLIAPGTGRESDGGLINFWDVQTGRLVSSFECGAGPVRCMTLSPDGTRLAFSADRFLGLLDMTTRRALWWQPGDRRNVLCLTFTADGRTLATGNADHKIRLWDVDTGHVIVELPKYYPTGVSGLAFSKDGMLASAAENTIDLWEVTSNRIVATLERHFSIIPDLLFFPDGRTLVSAGGDREIKVWDVQAAVDQRANQSAAEFQAGISRISGELAPALRIGRVAIGRFVKTQSEAAPGVGHAAIAEVGFLTPETTDTLRHRRQPRTTHGCVLDRANWIYRWSRAWFHRWLDSNTTPHVRGVGPKVSEIKTGTTEKSRGQR